jgi:hypothetical protein
MDKLISYRAKAEMSIRVKQILRELCISSWYSEPYHQNQNFSENRYDTLKAGTNRVMSLSGAPENTWLLALACVCLLLNQLQVQLLNGRLHYKRTYPSSYSSPSMSWYTITLTPIISLRYQMRHRVGGLVL